MERTVDVGLSTYCMSIDEAGNDELGVFEGNDVNVDISLLAHYFLDQRFFYIINKPINVPSRVNSK